MTDLPRLFAEELEKFFWIIEGFDDEEPEQEPEAPTP